MKKKIILALLVSAVAASTSFALNLSVGGGINLGFQSTSGTRELSRVMTVVNPAVPSLVVTQTVDYKEAFASSYIPLGFKGTMAIEYAEFSLGYTALLSVSNTVEGTDTKTSTSASLLALELLGKYPIPVAGITLEPVLGLGLDYALAVSTKNDSGTTEFVRDKDGHYYDNTDLYTSLKLVGGCGAIFKISDKIDLTTRAKPAWEIYNPGQAKLKDKVYTKSNNVLSLTPSVDVLLGYKVGTL